MSDLIQNALAIPEKPEVCAIRHIRSYSLEITDATAVITKATLDGALAEIVTRLYNDLTNRFNLPEIQSILTADPSRKMAIRLSLQLIDEGASEREIRHAARLDLHAFDEFVERERPKLLPTIDKAARPQ